MMRWLLAVLALLPLAATAQPRIVSGSGTYATGPRILGEPAFAFELDALEQAEASRPGWPVTTTRASTRMCFTGTAWQTVPANTPCIGRYGLASFGAGTNYAVNSAGPFDAAPWFLSGSPSLESLGNGVWRATSTGASDYVAQTGPAVAAGEIWTVTAEVQGATSGGVRLRALNATAAGGTGVQCTRDVGAEWTRVSCTQTAVADGQAQATLYFDSGASRGSVQFRQIQLEKSPTPGPRHDCGGSACSWAADVHTVSTAGWPVASGEVRLAYTPLASGVPASGQYLFAVRDSASNGIDIYVHTDGRLYVRSGDGVGTTAWTGVLTWVGGTPYDVIMRWGDGRVSIQRGDTVAGSATLKPLTVLPATAAIGSSFGGSGPANGHLRLIRVSGTP